MRSILRSHLRSSKLLKNILLTFWYFDDYQMQPQKLTSLYLNFRSYFYKPPQSSYLIF